MAAINVPFVNVIVHQPGKEAQDPVPVVMLNQKLHLKGLEQALGLQRLRIITAEHPQGIFLTADNDGLINLDPLAPGSTIVVCGEPAPDNSSTDYFKETLEEIRHNTAITRRTVSHFMIQRVQDYMDPGSTNSSNPNEESFRKEVTQHYGYKNARNVPELCMLTGREHDWHDLAAGHIVPRARAAQARVDVNIQAINSPRNGIYWSRAVEGAWSAGIFCFASPAPDVFKFTLLDKSYSDQRVQDWPLGRNPLRTSTKNNLGDMTWGHLHATGQLQFLPGNAGRPYRRALCFMAHMALLSSSQRSLVRPDDVDSQADEFDYMSEDGKIEETVAWINHMKIDHKAEGGSEESEEQEVEEL